MKLKRSNLSELFIFPIWFQEMWDILRTIANTSKNVILETVMTRTNLWNPIKIAVFAVMLGMVIKITQHLTKPVNCDRKKTTVIPLYFLNILKTNTVSVEKMRMETHLVRPNARIHWMHLQNNNKYFNGVLHDLIQSTNHIRQKQWKIYWKAQNKKRQHLIAHDVVKKLTTLNTNNGKETGKPQMKKPQHLKAHYVVKKILLQILMLFYF